MNINGLKKHKELAKNMLKKELSIPEKERDDYKIDKIAKGIQNLTKKIKSKRKK